jgi:small subunit ribosomal protein S6
MSSLRTYETLFIVQPNATEEEVEAVASGVENLVKQDGGTIVLRDIWGKRRLAYEVKKFTDGIYVLVRFEADPEVLAKLENNFKLNDEVIRHIIVYFDEKTLRLEEEQKKRTAALMAQRSESRDDDDDDRPRRSRDRKDESSSETPKPAAKEEEEPAEAAVEA